MLLLSLVSVIETFQDELMTGAASGGVVVRSLVLMLLLSTLTALRYNNGYAVELLDDVVRLLSLSDDVVRLYSALTAAAASGTAVVGAVVALMMFFTLLQVFRLCPVLVGCI